MPYLCLANCTKYSNSSFNLVKNRGWLINGNSKNGYFFDYKMGDQLIHGVDLCTAKYGTQLNVTNHSYLEPTVILQSIYSKNNHTLIFKQTQLN